MAKLEQVATYYIRKWGKISKFDGIAKVVEDFAPIMGTRKMPANFTLEFNHISSRSKWLSLVCTKWACIYDTRVVYSINALNYLAGGTFPIFPTPAGRNTKINLFDVTTLLLAPKIQSSDLSEPNELKAKYFVPEAQVYTAYLSLLTSVSDLLWSDQNRIHDVEGLLFSFADTKLYFSVFKEIQSRAANQHDHKDMPGARC